MRHLFFYGVLLGDIASPAIKQLLSGLGPGRPATTPGLLYAVPDPRGWYPVLLPGSGEVRGSVHRADDVNLAALDRFEGVDPAHPRAGEYRRERILVTPQSGAPLGAEAYLYNRSDLATFTVIAHGDFARWLRETGHAAFAG